MFNKSIEAAPEDRLSRRIFPRRSAKCHPSRPTSRGLPFNLADQRLTRQFPGGQHWRKDAGKGASGQAVHDFEGF